MSKIKKLLVKYGPRAVGMGLNSLATVAPKLAAQKTLDIFCSPRAGRIKPHQEKFLKDFEKKTVKYNGNEVMTYHFKGTGPRILLCHGWESNASRWRKLIAPLKAANIDIVAMDAPAHGASNGTKFTALLYAQMIDQVAQEFKPDVICGHSVGGMAAIFYLHDHKPSFVKRAVILASPDRLLDITDNYFGMIKGSQRLRTSYDRLFKEQFENNIEHYSSAKYASNLDLPAIIIHDKKDRINKYDEGERIREAWRESILYSTSGLGHGLQSSEVFDQVVSFMKEIPTLTRV